MIEITCPICSNRIKVDMDSPQTVCQCGANLIVWERLNEKYEIDYMVEVLNQPVLLRKNALKYRKERTFYIVKDERNQYSLYDANDKGSALADNYFDVIARMTKEFLMLAYGLESGDNVKIKIEIP